MNRPQKVNSPSDPSLSDQSLFDNTMSFDPLSSGVERSPKNGMFLDDQLLPAHFRLLHPDVPGGPDFIAGIASRDVSVLHMLFDSYAPSLYGQILTVVKDSECAVRILEKTLLYSVKHIQEHNPPMRLHSWMLQIANFKILEEAAIAVVGKNLPDDLSWECYREAWSGLHATEKEVLEGSAFKAIRHEEMAIRLELPLEVLQLRISTALCHFHTLLSSLAA